MPRQATFAMFSERQIRIDNDRCVPAAKQESGFLAGGTVRERAPTREAVPWCSISALDGRSSSGTTDDLAHRDSPSGARLCHEVFVDDSPRISRRHYGDALGTDSDTAVGMLSHDHVRDVMSSRHRRARGSQPTQART